MAAHTSPQLQLLPHSNQIINPARINPGGSSANVMKAKGSKQSQHQTLDPYAKKNII